MFSILRKIWQTGMVTKRVFCDKNTQSISKNLSYDTMSDRKDTENDLGQRMQEKIKKILGKSLHIRHVDSGSCNGCDFELTMLTNPIYDIQRFGVDFVASPRHADLLMVTGGVTRNLEEALWKTYHATSNPKMVMAIGACACGEGILGETYANHNGVAKIVPVYVRVHGCPPPPEEIIKGILLALDQYERKGLHH